MAGNQSIRMPGDIHQPMTFYGALTVGHLIRIGLPTALAIGATYPPTTLISLATVLLAAVLGLGLAFFRPYGRPLDHHLRNLIRYHIERRGAADSLVATTQQSRLRLADGTVIGVIEVNPTNLAMQSGSAQAAFHGIYQSLLDTISYPIEVHSRQHGIDLSQYITDLTAADENGNIADTAPLRNTYAAYCRHFTESDLVTTDHHIVIRVDPSGLRTATTLFARLLEKLPADMQEALDDHVPFDSDLLHPDTPAADTHMMELDRRCTEVEQAISRGGLTADRVTGQHLVELVEQWRIPRPQSTGQWTTTPGPDAGDDYRKTIAITEPPSQVSLAWPLDLLQVDGRVDVTQVIHPTNTSDVTDRLNRTVERLTAEIESKQEQGYSGAHRYQARLDDANWMLNRLADREDSPVEYACYITAHHPDRQQCLDTLDYVTTQLETKQFEYSQSVFQTDSAYRSQSPFHPDMLRETMLMPSYSAAAGFPFGTTDAIAGAGIVYGADHTDRTPVMLDRFAWSAGHAVRMGKTGSGKSFATKLALIRALLVYDDLQVYILDPKGGEYGNLIDALGGYVGTIGQDRLRFDHDLTCFQVADVADTDNTELLTAAAHRIYQTVSEDQRPTLVYIDEAHKLLEYGPGRDILTTFVREARSTNTCVTLISQAASDFTSTRQGRVILDNTTAKFFHRHESVDQPTVQYFDLSEREAQELTALKEGTDVPYSEALVKVSGRIDTKIRVQPTAAEFRAITAAEPGDDTADVPADIEVTS